MRPATGWIGELHFHAFFRQRVVQFADAMLGLGHGHAVAGNDDHASGGRHDLRRVFGRGALGRALFGVRLAGLDLPESPEQHVGERTIHRLAHDDREDQAGRTVQRPGGDQQFVVEHEAHRHGRQAGVGVQQRDHGRHVGPADRDNQHHAEGQAPAE